MKTVTAHVKNNNIVTIICPACNTVKHASTKNLRHPKNSVKIRCHCNEVFQVKVNFRRHFRKKISIPGNYLITDPNGAGGGVIHIRNISRGGIGFTVSGVHSITKDSTLNLEFQLNDKKMTQMKKNAIVRSVQGNSIGCEFADQEKLEKELGFFLQF